MSTPCGVLGSAQPIGRALLASSAKAVGGPLEVRLSDHDIELEDEVPYFFTVLRTPADFPASPRELYIGLDTSSSYERVKQIFPDEIVGTLAASVVGALGLLWLYVWLSVCTSTDLLRGAPCRSPEHRRLCAKFGDRSVPPNLISSWLHAV